MPYFITLGGDRHKNSARIVAAFHAARRRFPEIALFILGETDEASHMTGMDAAGLTFETMERYAYHLQHARGLIFCSTHEGLGLPPIEAMAAGCPVIVSDIPVMHETCQDAACFADPASVESIAAAIGVVHEAAAFWARKAAHGFEAYARKSDDAGTAWLAVYARLEKRRTT
jgi:glycosyltransferase involved in cell wall biosynthesis